MLGNATIASAIFFLQYKKCACNLYSGVNHLEMNAHNNFHSAFIERVFDINMPPYSKLRVALWTRV